MAGSEQCDTSQTWNDITDWWGETGQLLFIDKDVWRGLIAWMVWTPLLFPDTRHANLDTAQRRGLALMQCMVTDQALCSNSTFPMQPQECFNLHDSWMSKKSLLALQEDGRSSVCIPSWASFSVLKGKNSFDDVSSAWFAKQVSANFWCVAGNASQLASSQLCNQMSASGSRQWASWESTCFGRSLTRGCQDHKLLPHRTHLDSLQPQC